MGKALTGVGRMLAVGQATTLALQPISGIFSIVLLWQHYPYRSKSDIGPSAFAPISCA